MILTRRRKMKTKHKNLYVVIDPDDRFEFPVFVGTLEEVAAYENVKPNSIVSAISHAKARKQVSKYKKVVLEE